ncbi:unnamed protein product, partial [Didymodactylos carnosus]
NVLKSRGLLNRLLKKQQSDAEIIQQFKSVERANMEITIRDNIDPSIGNPLISLLNRRDKFEKKDFEEIVCYNEELWEALNVRKFENVFILDINRIGKELPQKYKNI